MSGDPAERILEEQLADFEQRLCEFVERGAGSSRQLLREAERLFELREQYPSVFERHQRLEGLVAEVIARERQAEIFGGPRGTEERRGCLLGWLFPKRR